MLTLSRMFSILKPNGRREWRARRWDTIADEMAGKRKFHADQSLALSYMGRKEQAQDEFLDAELAHMAEQNARDMARRIRSGR